MKRIKPKKSKWVKRVDLNNKTYSYFKKEDHKECIERSKDRSLIFEYAEWYISFYKNTRDFFKRKAVNKIIWLIIGILITRFLESALPLLRIALKRFCH